MLKILSIVLLVYAIACLLLYVKQRSILYYPTPENLNVNAEPLWLQTAQHKIKLWVINSKNSSQQKPAIIYFGGNAEQVENNVTDFKSMFTDFSVYVVNYRGYGGSSGSPTEKGLFNDALAIYDQLITQHSTINVIGRSLGSGVASFLAANRTVSKLVLTTPYDSISSVAQTHYPIFPVKWLIKDTFDSVRYAASIKSKILVLYAENDQVIPLKHTTKLIQALPHASSQMITGSSHNDISSSPQYQKLLAEFINYDSS